MIRFLTSTVGALRSLHRRLPWPLADIAVGSFVGASLALLLAALIQVVATVGALTALTPSEIWALNADRWLQGLRWVSLYGAGYGVFFAFWARAAHWLEQRPRIRDVVVASTGLAILLGLILGTAATGRSNATRTLGRLTEGDVGQTVASQQAALSGLSESARQLLSSLRATELEVQASRRELETTLAGLAQHERAAASSVGSLREVWARRFSASSRIPSATSSSAARIAPWMRGAVRASGACGSLLWSFIEITPR